MRAFHCQVYFCHVHPEVDLAGTWAFEFSVVLPCSPGIIAFDYSTTRRLCQKVRLESLLDCCDRYAANVHCTTRATRDLVQACSMSATRLITSWINELVNMVSSNISFCVLEECSFKAGVS